MSESPELESGDVQPNDSDASGNEQPVYSTDQLFGAKTKVKILHEDSEYVLMITRNNRLVLNKI